MTSSPGIAFALVAFCAVWLSSSWKLPNSFMLLLEAHELVKQRPGDKGPTNSNSGAFHVAKINFGDPRLLQVAQHMKLDTKSFTLECGVLDVGPCGVGVGSWIWDDASSITAGNLQRANAAVMFGNWMRKLRPRGLQLTLPAPDSVGNASLIEKRPSYDCHRRASGSCVQLDLILALPRPQRLQQLLPQVVQLGIHRVVLVGATNVEEKYFESSALQAANLRQRLTHGLQQVGEASVPEVLIFPSRNAWLSDGVNLLDELWPLDAFQRVVADPSVSQSAGPPRKVDPERGRDGKIVVAIGPEAGWEQDELNMLLGAGFNGVGLGSRILRTDVAVLSVLARAQQGVLL